jgi:hypothetical protein
LGKDYCVSHAEAKGEAIQGTRFYAIGSGVVVDMRFTEPAHHEDGVGNYVVVDHHNGVVSVYMHLAKVLVKKGDCVKAYSVLGEVGDPKLHPPPNCPHLHLEIRKNGVSSLNIPGNDRYAYVSRDGETKLSPPLGNESDVIAWIDRNFYDPDRFLLARPLNTEVEPFELPMPGSGSDGVIGTEDLVPDEIRQQIEDCWVKLKARGGNYSIHDCFESADRRLAELIPDTKEVQRTIGSGAWLSSFQEMGRVDFALIEYPESNHPGPYSLLVNGMPRIVEVNANQGVNTAVLNHPLYPSLLARFREANPDSFKDMPIVLRLSFGYPAFVGRTTTSARGQRFIFAHMLNACWACTMAGTGLVAYDFNRDGNFIGQTLIDLRTDLTWVRTECGWEVRTP